VAKETEKKTPRDLLRVIFRRWRVFLSVATGIAFAILVAALYVPLKYTGETIFERRIDFGAVESRREEAESFESLRVTLMHELGSTEALEKAAEQVGLTRGMPRGTDGRILTEAGEMMLQDLVTTLRKGLRVSFNVRSPRVDLVSVAFTHKDPWLAQALPNQLVTNYIESASAKVVARLTGSHDFLEERVTETSERLKELRNARITFESDHAGAMPNSPTELGERLRDIAADIDTKRPEQEKAKRKVERLEAVLKAATNTDEPFRTIKGPNPELDRLNRQLQDYEDLLAAALPPGGRMTENHPDVKALRGRIEQVKKRIEETEKEVTLQTEYGSEDTQAMLSMQLADARAELDLATNELARLEGRQAALQKLQADFGPVRQKYVDLLDQQEKKQTEVDRWQKQLTGVQMSLAAEVAKKRTHLETTQFAKKQFRPSSPKLELVLAAALLGGLIAAGGVVFLLQALDRTLNTTEDAIEAFGLPICGVTGEIVSPRQRRTRRLLRWVGRPVVGLVIVLVLGVATLNIVLWLRYPEEHARWKASPAGYITRGISDGVQSLRNRI